ncbi:UDP-glucose 4-epimerase [Frankia sp. CNm7]|uniref:UDP-glucose 4-epimerase n=1 Tax=Frankia nepalensis TaxID=1836974 RepID=A0A937UP18_9ACTN|nr:NAD-dependent epimerase/dehydratase family protein [Frankia nepalensis]MBL7495532.1 UDP-glucose 4-epimerase [Frankia nepalensis]MBL7509813.1 UDP-glucose 4-epimerase [Frankia nepalensis]MBL7517522.1 UDP-glucose 4-epimerase [Frankia nepalensis]MBL7626805.1 UDP-glucose 4-epimerase [Frankia nepalensis]
MRPHGGGSRVLVTGAGGFIGGVLADLLAARGHRVTALVRGHGPVRGGHALAGDVEVVTADLLDPRSLAAARVDRGFDAVCHLAALTRVRQSRDEPLRYFETNVTGTINLLAALDRGFDASGRAPTVVLGSTAAVYGDPDAGPIPESRPPDPRHPYGASKLAAEQVIAHQAATGRIGAVVLRSFNVAGAAPGHVDRDATRIIPAALRVAAGEADAFRINGDGASLREYVHVDDVAAAYALALEATRPGDRRVYNVGSGTGVSVNDVLAAVERVTGRPVRRVSGPPVAEPRALVVDSHRIRAELGWEPRRSALDRIITDAWRWSHQPTVEAAANGGPPSRTDVTNTAPL